MRTLITGASGFIGKSFLSQSLPGEIHVLSRKKISEGKFYQFEHTGDLQDTNLIKKLTELKFNRVIHLAWQGLPELTEANNKTNLFMTKNFLRAMIDSGIEEINLVGTCLEYGDLTTEVNESDIGKNIGEFGETKLDLLDFVKAQEIAFRWFRVFYAYGPNQHKQSLLSAAYESTVKSARFIIRDPKLARDFIYVDDVSRAIRMLVNTPSSYGVFNVGSGTSTSITQLVNSLQTKMNLPTTILEEFDLSLRANCAKIGDACGWKSEVGVEQGVSQFIKWREKE